MTAAAAPRLRLLCLHGYHGSAATLRAQLQPLFGPLESLVELVAIDAPSLAAGDFGWWHAVDDERDGASDDPGVFPKHKHYKGWTRTRDAIVAAFQRLGPFDGVLGFSQGAALTGLVVGLRATHGLAFDFAIEVSGFLSTDPELLPLYDHPEAYALPSLHLLGRSDSIVPPANTRALAARFASPVIVEHGGGHVVASEPAVREQVRAFLEARLAARRAPARTGAVEVPLWPGRAAPSMRVTFPGRAPAPALVVLRGGAYATSEGSGGGTAEWAAAHGMVGVEVRYRTAGTGDVHPAGFADAARAVRLVRARAAEWGIDAAKVAVVGYSAGGHLASLLSTQPDLYVDPADDLARVPARPDLLVLAYPLVSFVEGYRPGAFVSSATNLFGERDPSLARRQQLSSELHVAAGHPPVFLWTTADDALVPAAHAQRFAEACERAGVPVHFTLYPHGAHGLGLALQQPGDLGRWTQDLLQWLEAQWKTQLPR